MSMFLLHRFAGSGELPPGTATRHARFVAEHKDVLIAYGPISQGRRGSGYAYYTNHVSGSAELARFLSDDPLAASSETIVEPWRHARIGRHQDVIAERPGFLGFLLFAPGVPNCESRRLELLDAHRRYFAARNETNFVAGGPLVAHDDPEKWRGTSFVIEMASREDFDEFLANEPFYMSKLYQSVDVYDWSRGPIILPG